MNLTQLEPIGLSVLASGLLYSIVVFVINDEHYKFHFVVLVLIIFIALFLITGYKYLMDRYKCEKMRNIIAIMKKK